MASLSVIIPLFNKEKDIVDTLKSVCNQSYSDFEIIIVNDGSTDSSVERIKSLNDKRIQLYSKSNEGVSTARNFGVDNATSNYVVFLDADDYWYPNHLENIFSLINKFPEHSWFAAAYEKKRNKNLITSMDSPIIEKGKDWAGVIEDFFKNSFIDCLINSSSVCFRKDFYKALNGFNTAVTHGEDIDLWIRAALQSNLIFTNTISSQHNLTGSNRSSNVQIQKRKNIFIDAFLEEEKKNPSLKKYLDLNRYSLAIQYKIAGDFQNFKKYNEGLHLENLNKKQDFLLNSNRNVLILMIKLQKYLEKLGLRLSSF